MNSSGLGQIPSQIRREEAGADRVIRLSEPPFPQMRIHLVELRESSEMIHKNMWSISGPFGIEPYEIAERQPFLAHKDGHFIQFKL